MLKSSATRLLFWGLGFSLLLLLVSSVDAQSRTANWTRWDVTLTDVDPEANRFRVIEDQDIEFWGRFERGTRRVALNNLEDITNISVEFEGEALPENCNQPRGAFCVTDEDGERIIRYSFPEPVTSETVNVVVEYDVIGALRVFNGGDQVQWQAIPAEHSGSIDESTLTIELPTELAPREEIDPIEAWGVPAAITVEDSVITARANRAINADQAFSIRAQFPHTPGARMADWQQAAEAQIAAQIVFETETLPLINLGVLALGLLIGVGGPLLWLMRALAARVPTSTVVPEYLTEPPGDLAPALAGYLTLSAAYVDPELTVATILDLAKRGYIRLEEYKDGGSRHKTIGFKRVTNHALNDAVNIYEKRLLDALFRQQNFRTVASLRDNFYNDFSYINDGIKLVAENEGYVDLGAPMCSHRWAQIGQILLVIAVVGGVILWGLVPALFRGVVLVAALTLITNGVALWAFSGWFSTLTKKGNLEGRKWMAFKRYLTNVSNNWSETEVTADLFNRYLPYAVAFRLEHEWVRRFTQTQTVPAPSWFVPLDPVPVAAADTVDKDERPVTRSASDDDDARVGAALFNASRPSDDAPATETAAGVSQPALDMNPAEMLNNVSSGITTTLNDISSSLTTMLNSAASALSSRPPATYEYNPPTTWNEDETYQFSDDDDDNRKSWWSTSSGSSSSSWDSGGSSWSGSDSGSSSFGDSGGGGADFD